MDETEKKLLWETFSSVMAYLVYPQELRKSIEKISGESANMNTFLEKFKQALSNEADPTHKTDGQIFLNDLRKRLA
jgi:hypothetical protein